ncbi:hypothetical protein F5B20DRAFT_582368 [Whalleya microplaca]|nr:hypothetical protein F5B20DRAFT_582368 [Whalleya microplaca]
MRASLHVNDMLVKYEKDFLNMESKHIIPRTATLDFTFPLSNRQPHFSELKAENLAAIPRSSDSSLKINDSVLVEPSAYSPISSSFGSVFSHGSCADSDFTLPTAPSSPRTPPIIADFDDGRQQDWALQTELFKQKRTSLGEDPKRVQLPSVRHLLPPIDLEDDDAIQRPRTRRRLESLCSSPELSKEHILSTRSSVSSHEDPITRNLNIWRQELDHQKNPLPRLQDLEGSSLNIKLECRDKPIFYRKTQQRPPQGYDCYYHPSQRPSSSPKPIAKKGRARAKQDTHCNIKYRIEEIDYIRFHKVDLKHVWDLIECDFRKMFPMDNKFERHTQGIQGAFYRDNLHMPDVANGGRTLLFTANGHVQACTRKVREQGEDKHYFGLVYLYPERAMNYDWVPEEARRFAAELHKERIKQKSRAQLEAMERGTWIEKVEDGSCTCCPKPDRERDKQKSALPKLSKKIDFNFTKLSKL